MRLLWALPGSLALAPPEHRDLSLALPSLMHSLVQSGRLVDGSLGCEKDHCDKLEGHEYRECMESCRFVQRKLCDSGCQKLCQRIEADPECWDNCSLLQEHLCTGGFVLDEAQFEVEEPDPAPETVQERVQDTPEPIDRDSSLWEAAQRAMTDGLTVIDEQRRKLGMAPVERARTVLLHAWAQMEFEEGFKLCLSTPFDNETEYITVDLAGGVLTGATPARVVFGDEFAYNTTRELQNNFSARTTVDEDSVTRSLYPCNPEFSNLLQGARMRLGLSRGRGASGGLLGRRYRAERGEGQPSLPDQYSSREHFPDCAFPVRQQGACGSCYSFAVAAMASERLCIARTKQKANQEEAAAFWAQPSLFQAHRRLRHNSSSSVGVRLSTQELVSCGSADRRNMRKPYCTLGPGGVPNTRYSAGCNGGSAYDALFYAHVYGLPTEECVPYASGGNSNEFRAGYLDLSAGKVPLCSALEQHSCHPARSMHRLQRPEVIANGDVDSIMRAIYESGPVYGTMDVHEDFMTAYPGKYPDNVYEVSPGSPYLGGHAVLVDGWGKDYWHIRNSWGNGWGLEGYAKIRRGVNTAHIEDQVHFARAAVGEFEEASAGDSDCIKVRQEGDSCSLTNVCDGEVRSVMVTYLGTPSNCGSWSLKVPKLLPGQSMQKTVQNARVCTVVKDDFVKNYDSTLYYQDVTYKYEGYNCVLKNTYTGTGTRKRSCGHLSAVIKPGGLAAAPPMMCAAGCAEVSGLSPSETTLD